MDTTTTAIRLPQTVAAVAGTKQGTFHRQKIVSVVKGDPGIHLRRLAAVVGISWNTCLHHVNRLEAKGVVSTQKVRGLVCVFDRTGGAVTGKTGHCLLRDERNMNVARFVAENPGCHQRAVCAGTDLAPSVVTRRLQSLEDAGLVERIREGRVTLVAPTEALESALQTDVAGDDPLQILF